MRLTDKDYETLAYQVEEGEDFATLEKDGEELEIRYECEEDSYQEVNLRVLNVSCTNEDGDEVDNDFDEWKLYQEVRAQKVD